MLVAVSIFMNRLYPVLLQEQYFSPVYSFNDKQMEINTATICFVVKQKNVLSPVLFPGHVLPSILFALSSVSLAS